MTREQHQKTAFEAFGGIRDDFILEAELPEAEPAAAPRWYASPAFAAVLCAVAALAVLAFIIRAGQRPPVGTGETEPSTGTMPIVIEDDTRDETRTETEAETETDTEQTEEESVEPRDPEEFPGPLLSQDDVNTSIRLTYDDKHPSRIRTIAFLDDGREALSYTLPDEYTVRVIRYTGTDPQTDAKHISFLIQFEGISTGADGTVSASVCGQSVYFIDNTTRGLIPIVGSGTDPVSAVCTGDRTHPTLADEVRDDFLRAFCTAAVARDELNGMFAAEDLFLVLEASSGHPDDTRLMQPLDALPDSFPWPILLGSGLVTASDCAPAGSLPDDLPADFAVRLEGQIGRWPDVIDTSAMLVSRGGMKTASDRLTLSDEELRTLYRLIVECDPASIPDDAGAPPYPVFPEYAFRLFIRLDGKTYSFKTNDTALQIFWYKLMVVESGEDDPNDPTDDWPGEGFADYWSGGMFNAYGWRSAHPQCLTDADYRRCEPLFRILIHVQGLMQDSPAWQTLPPDEELYL